VAEGIERRDQLAVLRELGCQLGQGHFFARPADARRIGRLLSIGSIPAARPARRSSSPSRRATVPRPRPAAGARGPRVTIPDTAAGARPGASR
jgi:predicted signal transduction protein with EAL and GGDEF domain